MFYQAVQVSRRMLFIQAKTRSAEFTIILKLILYISGHIKTETFTSKFKQKWFTTK